MNQDHAKGGKALEQGERGGGGWGRGSDMELGLGSKERGADVSSRERTWGGGGLEKRERAGEGSE